MGLMYAQAPVRRNVLDSSCHYCGKFQEILLGRDGRRDTIECT